MFQINKKIDFQRWIYFKAVETQSKYLGLPSFVGNSRVVVVFEALTQTLALRHG
jgi:hypothetical protein